MSESDLANAKELRSISDNMKVYHAKRPMIVFDTDSVKLQSVSETNPKIVNQMYKKYNAERIAKETVANTLGLVTKMGNKTISECSSYVELKTKDYLR